MVIITIRQICIIPSIEKINFKTVIIYTCMYCTRVEQVLDTKTTFTAGTKYSLGFRSVNANVMRRCLQTTWLKLCNGWNENNMVGRSEISTSGSEHISGSKE